MVKIKKKENKLSFKKKLLIMFIVFIMILAIIGSVYFYLKYKESTTKNDNTNTNKPAEVKEKTTSFNFIAVGDVLLHDGVYQAANTYKVGSDGYYTYDFSSMFTDLADIIKNYDVKFYNQESIIGGKNLGLSGYPLFNSPDEIGDDLVNIGFNVVNLANNHSMDKGVVGATYSANYWHSKSNVLAVGSYTSQEQRDNIEIKEVNGIKYAVLSYTYGTNGITVPSGYEYLVNVWPTDSDADFLAYEAQVKKDVESVRSKVDVLIVSMHWGTEYQIGEYNTYQEQAAEYLSSLGVDAVIGTHPHVVQPVEYVGNTLVAYSLGNLISAQDGTAKRIGGIVAFTVTKTTKGDKTLKVSLGDVKADLLYTYRTDSYKNFEVMPFNKLNDTLLYGYKSIYSQYEAYLNPKNDSRIQVGFIGDGE